MDEPKINPPRYKNFGIRVPIPLYEMLKKEANKNFRSLSREVTMRLNDSFQNTKLKG